MSRWNSSTRRSRLPKDWQSRRRQVLSRDDWICQIGLSGCLTEASDVDHIVAGDDHRLENLRAACSYCHAKKSSAEGHARRRELLSRRFRPRDRHPGRP